MPYDLRTLQTQAGQDIRQNILASFPHGIAYARRDHYLSNIYLHQSVCGASFNRRVNRFSDRLKHARLLRGYTQKTLARSTGLSQSAIGSYESGLRQSSRSLRKLARVLKVELEWLETGKGPMTLPMESYDLSDTLPAAASLSEPLPRALTRQARVLAPWPFPNISPAQFDTLTPDDRITLEALTQTFIQASQTRRGIKPGNRKICNPVCSARDSNK